MTAPRDNVPGMGTHEQDIKENTGATVDLLVSVESLLTSIDAKLDRLIRAVQQSR